ncbi:hypothetical protein BJV77DRAFT_1162138 [Russula vinacea]|nr:hypothetical protein BJV77DRAFT_1162138 [Russula vinacea]
MNLNGRKRRESSPHSRRVLPPQARGTSSPTITPSWRPLNRPFPPTMSEEARHLSNRPRPPWLCKMSLTANRTGSRNRRSGGRRFRNGKDASPSQCRRVTMTRSMSSLEMRMMDRGSQGW